MKTLIPILTALTIPLVLMNLLGGLVSGIWLAFLGEWKAIGFGILLLIISSFAIGIAMLPGLLFAAPAAAAIEKSNNALGIFFAGLSSIYTGVVMFGWAMFVFLFFNKISDSASVIPMLLWSYGAVTGPWAHMAQKDEQASGGRGNSLAFIPVFFLSIGYLLMIVTALIFGATLLTCASIVGVSLLLGSVVVFSAAVAEDRARRNLGYL
ncbi:hypothetical protein OAG53_01045 [Akkermansiaceae bacterium]|nr:hypothetical protein [Akkermansiaceae bacterium]